MPNFFTVIHHTHLQVQSTFSWPVTTTWHSSVVSVCAEVHFHLAPPVQDSLEWELTKGKNCHCLQLCLQGPAGQEMLFSWECLVKMTDFYINSVGHKFSANSQRAFKPKQLFVAQIILNNSSVSCTLFWLHFFEYFRSTHANYYKAFLLQLASSWKQN